MTLLRGDWVHPSVRDAAIEFLMDRPADRQRFLATCTLEGALLAVSTAGGSEGKRNLPLVRDRSDWATLSDRIDVLTSSLGRGDENALLQTLITSLRFVARGRTGLHSVSLVRLAERVLGSLRTKWDASDQALPPGPVVQWFRVATLAKSLQQSPRLFKTWAHLLDQCTRVDAEDELDDVDLSRVDTLFEFARLIRGYEPRFLDAVEARDALAQIAAGVVPACQATLEEMESLDSNEVVQVWAGDVGKYYEEPVEPDRDERNAKDWLEAAVSALGEISDAGIAQSDAATALLDPANTHLGVRQERQTNRENWEEEARNQAYEEDDTPRERGTGSNFDLDDFFADL